MKILHVNDVASVGSILVRASEGRDALYQPHLRSDAGEGALGSLKLGVKRLQDAQKISRTFERGAFTNLHVHYATFANLAELARLEYSLHVHGADILLDPGTGGLKARLALRGIERATKIVVSTPDLIAPAQKLRPDAVHVPNPMEIPPPRPAKQERPRTASSPRVIMLSKMDPLKGWDRQIELIERLKQALPELELGFFTHGQLPEEVRAELRRRLQALGARATPRLPRDQFLARLADHDFAIGQMEVGSLGMSEMEAMAAAVPVVADARAHVAYGHRPPVIEPARAVDELVELWNDEQSRRARGEAGRAFIAEVHDPKRALAALSKLLG